MKRVILAVVGTVGGLVALLSFKTHTHAIAGAGPLPEQSVPSGTTRTSGSAASSPSATSGSSSAQATRQYVGSAITTRYGIVQVKVKVSGSRIVDVGFVQLTAFDGRSQEINTQAAPYLLRETLDAQSARIDTVSGATYTSEGYIQSLQSALDRAGIR